MYRAGIMGTGSALPERVMTNQDLESLVETSDEWITTRTGIKERRIADPDDSLSRYTIEASRQAIEAAGIQADELDMIICATVTPDQPLPAAACFIQAGLGLKGAASFDVQAGCTGFVYGLTIAEQFIVSGKARRVLVVGAELLSNFLNWDDRSTCVIFADGAGAVVVGRAEEPYGILASEIRSDGEMRDFISIPAGGTKQPITHDAIDKKLHLIHMRGNETFKLAVRSLTEISTQVLNQGKVSAEELDLFVPHQANKRIIDAVGKRLGLGDDRVYVNIDRVGNTSSASIPIALDEVVRSGRVRPDDTILMSAFGAGLTWGAVLMRWGR